MISTYALESVLLVFGNVSETERAELFTELRKRWCPSCGKLQPPGGCKCNNGTSVGLTASEVDHHGELRLVVHVDEHEGECFISEKFWLALGEHAGWAGSLDAEAQALRVKLVEVRARLMRAMTMPGIMADTVIANMSSNLRQLDRLIGLADPNEHEADRLLVERLIARRGL